MKSTSSLLEISIVNSDVEHRYSLLFLVLVGRLLAEVRACRSVID